MGFTVEGVRVAAVARKNTITIAYQKRALRRAFWQKLDESSPTSRAGVEDIIAASRKSLFRTQRNLTPFGCTTDI
jgi:hypothetical protein